jgi:hypothetical protein
LVQLLECLDDSFRRAGNLQHIMAPTAVLKSAAAPPEPLSSAQDLAEALCAVGWCEELLET